MATVNQVQSITLLANADLKANQFHFVKMTSTDKTIALAAAVTDAVVGILLNKPGEVTLLAGEVAEVAYAGIAKVQAGETIAAGNPVGPAADGRAQHANTTNDVIAGTAITGGLVGEIIEVLLGSNNVA